MASIGLGIATPIPDSSAASHAIVRPWLRLPLRQAGVRPKSSEKLFILNHRL